MSAWTNLLAASSLAVGTAWDLISSPRTGTGDDVYIEQIQSVLLDATTASVVLDDSIQSISGDGEISSTVTITDAETALLDSTITVETA